MMQRRTIIPAVACFILMMWLSCSRDHLYYDTQARQNVQLNIDWSKTAFMPESKGYNEDNRLNGVTIFAYDSVTHRLAAEFPPNANWQNPEIYLPVGTYNLVAVNDSRAELPSICFNTGVRFEDFRAAVDADTVYTNNYPEYLAVSTLRNVRVADYRDYFYDRPEDHIVYKEAMQVYTVQRPVTKRINITVTVNGMNYCRGMQTSYLTGLSKGVDLSTMQPSKETVVYAFNLVNRAFRENSQSQAVIRQSFNSFSFNEANLKEGNRFELVLNFVLINDELHTVTFDVTGQFEKWLEEHSIDLDLGLDLDLDINLELDVTLPPTIPGGPNDGQSGGIRNETVPWNDITQDITI